MYNFFEKIFEKGIVPILVVKDMNTAVPTCEAIIEAGIKTVEIVLRTLEAMDAVKKIKKALPEIKIGGGTVFTIDQIKQLLDCGASYIVCPGIDEKLVEFCIDKKMPILPGCVTPSEVQKAQHYKLNVLKFFPAFEMGSINSMKMYNGPFPEVKFIPTGGINSDNMNNFLECEHVLAVGGAWMFTKNDVLIKNDFTGITKNICEDIEAVKLIRNIKN